MFDELMSMLNRLKLKDDAKREKALEEIDEIRESYEESKRQIIKLIDESSKQKLKKSILESIEERKKTDFNELDEISKIYYYDILIDILSGQFKVTDEDMIKLSINVTLDRKFDTSAYINSLGKHLEGSSLKIQGHSFKPNIIKPNSRGAEVLELILAVINE